MTDLPSDSVSVILPTYNRAATLRRACESVLSQMPPVLELIVVDDGSTDDTADVLSTLVRTDARLRYVRQDNQGACAARNLGIELARGKLIAFQDSDDEWLPGKLKSQLEARGGKPALVFTSHTVIFLDGHQEIRPSNGVPVDRNDLVSRLISQNFISTQTVLLDRSLLGESRFDPQLRRLQDWDLWLSIIERLDFKIIFVDDPLVKLFRQDDSLSNSDVHYHQSLKEIFRKHERLYRRYPKTYIRRRVKLALQTFIGKFTSTRLGPIHR
jgi:glycosyltransferase involved in cell wall biosynthesis